MAKLVEQNQRLSKDADNLTKALKGDSQAQGAWGEMLLEKLLDGSGLVKGQEYSMQESTTLADGSRLRPDAVIFLPDDKHLIIDSKVSLLHYDRFTANTDEAERDKLLKQHVDSLRVHAKGLGKDYPNCTVCKAWTSC
ncbi:MAG: DNA recombination protein RmuC [Flavobacteriales bacterium]|nr:DNA recombination protein RmuC [Flavobacteriales bacterium]